MLPGTFEKYHKFTIVFTVLMHMQGQNNFDLISFFFDSKLWKTQLKLARRKLDVSCQKKLRLRVD